MLLSFIKLNISQLDSGCLLRWCRWCTDMTAQLVTHSRTIWHWHTHTHTHSAGVLKSLTFITYNKLESVQHFLVFDQSMWPSSSGQIFLPQTSCGVRCFTLLLPWKPPDNLSPMASNPTNIPDKQKWLNICLVRADPLKPTEIKADTSRFADRVQALNWISGALMQMKPGILAQQIRLMII